MPIATNRQKENLAAEYGVRAVSASLHTASPGTTGASEVTGGTYARRPITWAAGTVDGVVTGSVTFDVPAGVTVTHAGLWSSDATPVFLDAVTITSQTFSTAGQLTVNFTYTQS